LASTPSIRSWIATSPVHQHRVGEVGLADHADQGLGQVVVDVGVDPQQHVPEVGKVVRRVERQPPRPRHRAAGEVGVVRGEVEPGEHHVPPLDPGRVLEPGTLDRGADGGRRPLVGAEEHASLPLR
jgi:hypothetical protein